MKTKIIIPTGEDIIKYYGTVHFFPAIFGKEPRRTIEYLEKHNAPADVIENARAVCGYLQKLLKQGGTKK